MRERILCVLLAIDADDGGSRRRKPSRNIRSRHERSPALLLRFTELPRAPRGAHVHQLAGVPAQDVRLDARRAHCSPDAGLRGLRRRHRLRGTAQHARLRRCARLARVRDVPCQRAHVPADEPRDGSRDVERHLVRGRSALAAILSRQGRRPAAEPRNLALQLPDGPALHRPTLVPGGRRCLHGNLGGRRAWRARRAATTRWCSGPWYGTTLISTIHWGSRRAAPRSISRPARTRTSMESAFSPTSLTPIHPKRSSPGTGATKGANATGRSSFEQVFGIPVEQAWQDWIRFEHEFQRRNLAEVRKFPVTPHA